MSKFTEFYKKVVADEAAKKEMTAILGSKALNEATDEELAKVGEVAKKLGLDITVEEAKAYLNGGSAELDDEELDAVAGGKPDEGKTYYPDSPEKPNPYLSKPPRPGQIG